jgi:gliding motility-associated-like protein
MMIEKLSAQIEFVQNKGQWNSKVNYRADFGAGSFFLENKGFTVLLNNPNDVLKAFEYSHGQVTGAKNKSIPTKDFIFHSHVYNVTFLGALPNALKMPDKSLKTFNNYFIGNDKSAWVNDCKIYNAVTYKNVYPNIDVRYYSTQEKLKYDFIVHPGGNPNAIALRYDGVTNLSIKNKELIIGTSIGSVKELDPYTYQTNTKGKSNVTTKYMVKDNVVTFDVGNYDPASTLVIDPQLVFATLTGSSANNYGFTATPGADGSFFAGGIVFSQGYPVSPGALQTNFAGGDHDMGIFKFSADGSQRLYATYIGGSGNDQPHSMIADAAGNLCIAGRSNSPNYPTTGISPSGGGYDIVVTKLNAAGTALVGSMKIGGSGDDGVNIEANIGGTLGTSSIKRNYGDDARSEVILDAIGNVYVASCTKSNNFPLVAPLQPTYGGRQDGVILKLNTNLSALLFSTYFGGSEEDACFVLSINPLTNNLYVSGATASGNLPGNTSGTIGVSSQGGIDGFITILNASSTSFIKTTYIGTGGIDLVYGIKFDKFGFPYIMGTTNSSWPIINATYSVAGSKQFVAKVRPDLSSYIYSTIFGGGSSVPKISPVAFLVDRCENVYVSGWGGETNSVDGFTLGNTFDMPLADPIQSNTDGKDFYLFVLKKDATSILFGSYFGQNNGFGDHVDGGTSRFDENGIIYQGICANCVRTSFPGIRFPTTPGVWAINNGSNQCNQAAVKIEMNFAGIAAQVQSEIDGEINDSLGCIPLTVNFKDLKAKGVTYYWNFNSAVFPNALDLTTTTPQATFTFNNVGVFRVRLIAEDLTTCNQRDTSYITIKTGRDKVLPQFRIRKVGDCTSKTFEFTNTTSTVAPITFLPRTFVWDFGDGSPVDTTNFAPPLNHTFPGFGTFNVKLRIFDDRFCNSPKDTIIPIRINDNVKADPRVTNELGCAPYTAIFKNESLAGLSWKWELVDAATNAIIGTSTDVVPTFPPLAIGNYKYRLIAFDSTTCNKIDTSVYKNIKVVQKPIAQGNWAPNPPEPNVPVRFSNSSSFASTYLWQFGDGETSTEFAPTHEYNATGDYKAKLIAISIAGCADTFLLDVSVIVNPLLDVPNAFTPGRFGVNSVVNVRGFGIGKMDWRVYNRWGQMIFRSNNKKQGWDGTYKGKLQPIDVYTYTLDVEFTDGKRLTKRGDITLIR